MKKIQDTIKKEEAEEEVNERTKDYSQKTTGKQKKEGREEKSRK